VGAVHRVEAVHVDVTLPRAGEPAATLYGTRVPRGEVGEYVLIDIGARGVFGRITDVWLPAAERSVVDEGVDAQERTVHPVGRVLLLSTLKLDGTQVRGIERHPRIGDPVFSAAPDVLTQMIAGLDDEDSPACFHMGHLAAAPDVSVRVPASRLIGRHLAVLGATGSGKSWTLAHIGEEVQRLGGKMLLIDATGEFAALRTLARHVSLGPASDGTEEQVAMPHHELSESEILALFRPSAGAQAPKLREAVRSLRLAHVLGPAHHLVHGEGWIRKADQPKKPFLDARREHITVVEGPRSPFDLRLLPGQIQLECIFDTDNQNPERFGRTAQNDLGFCTSLISRIYDLIQAEDAMAVLAPEDDRPSVLKVIDDFVKGPPAILRVSLRSLPSAYFLRELVVNAIGGHLLRRARQGAYDKRPVLVAVDEAHQFFGRTIGDEYVSSRLENFDSIAKEGRKYGLTVCMATQRPADLPAGVISQAGMLLVHRLADGRDRERIEQASSELDREAAQLLPTLVPGEAVFVGVDFPVPMAVKVMMPEHKPFSAGPQYHRSWKR
jgi:DNA helicase HerA-like ATPase